MNQTLLDAIKSRRSNRSFSPDQVQEAHLAPVLEAGTYAPTAMGRQTPVIVAVQDRETIAQLSKMNAAVIGKDMDPYYGAPTIVLVLGPDNAGTVVEDCTCVLNTMLLAAHAMDLAAVWVHREKEMFDTAEGKALLKKWNLPETLRGVGSIAVGYPAQPAPEAPPRKSDYIVRV